MDTWGFWDEQKEAATYADVTGTANAATAAFKAQFGGASLLFVAGCQLQDARVIVPCTNGWRLCNLGWGFFPSGDTFNSEAGALAYAKECSWYRYQLRKTIER